MARPDIWDALARERGAGEARVRLEADRGGAEPPEPFEESGSTQAQHVVEVVFNPVCGVADIAQARRELLTGRRFGPAAGF